MTKKKICLGPCIKGITLSVPLKEEVSLKDNFLKFKYKSYNMVFPVFLKKKLKTSRKQERVAIKKNKKIQQIYPQAAKEMAQ